MKKAILLVILYAVFMTGCDEYDMTLEITYQPETAESFTASEEVSCEAAEICSDTIPSELPETFSPEIIEIQETVTVSEEILFTESECEEQQEPESTEIPEETASETTTAEPEMAVQETESVMLTEFVTETETVPEITETEPILEAEPVIETESVTEPETVPELSEYEKAQIVYEYMLENGHGTCVNYACQTYEKCQEIGLPCYIVWTDAGLYGHTANAVCVNDIWFIMDTQAGSFLESNYGFTEVVNMNCELIADGSMLSNYSYQELFQE